MGGPPMLAEARRVLSLAMPMIVAHLGNMAMGVVDALIVARAGTKPLAAMALGHVWLWGTLMIANGIAMGVDPVISQAHGAGDPRGVALAYQRGIVVSVLLGIPLALSWLSTEPVLLAFGQDRALAVEAAEFVR